MNFFPYEIPSFNVVYHTIGRDVKAAALYLKLLGYIKKCHFLDYSVVDAFRKTFKKYKKRVCFIFEDKEWTYQEVEDYSNQVANYFSSRGLKKGDEVALMLGNCPEYVCIWLGLAKIGVVTAFINTNLKDASLAHSFNIIKPKTIIFGTEYAEALNDALPHCENKESWEMYQFESSSIECNLSIPCKSLTDILENSSKSPIDKNKIKIHFHDKLFYIYTSGTTGFPKAAQIMHSRFFMFGAGAKIMSRLKENEVYYNPLPLYHTAGGVLFLSVILLFGGKMVIRKKFSASNFWKDAVKYQATVSQYIGEICRFLLNQPPCPEETQHTIRLMEGNGLKPNVWKEFQERFKVEKIIEAYGSTEGNANLINLSGKVGAVGFISRLAPFIYPTVLIKVDPDTGEPIRNDKGLCIRCKPGEPGQIVGEIKDNCVRAFHGYVDESESKKKIITNCFKQGDKVFLSGDILVMDEEGYFYFMDRTGDTFRWRGENVSASEIEDVISKVSGFSACIVYGIEIPNAEGRAGMAAIECKEEDIDMDEFCKEVFKKLPVYAVPVFIRLCSDIESTGTYKLKKINLRKEGYNPHDISDPIYLLDVKSKTYNKLTKDIFDQIQNGEIIL